MYVRMFNERYEISRHNAKRFLIKQENVLWDYFFATNGRH